MEFWFCVSVVGIVSFIVNDGVVVVVIGWLGSVVNVVKFLVSIGAKLVVNVEIWVSFLVVVEVAVLVG